MFEITLRFPNDALRPKLEAFFGTDRLPGAIKRTIRDAMVNKRVQDLSQQREGELRTQLQAELAEAAQGIQNDFDEDETP